MPDTYIATNIANEYIKLNGFTPSDISITFINSNNTINIAGTKKVDFIFARVIGFESTTVNLVSAAVKEIAVPTPLGRLLGSLSETN